MFPECSLQDAADADSRLSCTAYEAINEWVRAIDRLDAP
jgi:hypothetical protein